MEMQKNKMLATILTLTIFLAMFVVLRPVISTEYINVDDYCWIEGMLHNDTYTLYPYAEESIDMGFSKYGEMIGYNEDTEIGVGIQYPGYASAGDTYDQTDDTSVDPFCNEYIGVDWWMNGWFIDIKYRTPAGSDREIWAMAIFSDGEQHGGDWITMPAVEATSAARPLWQEDPPYANPDSVEYTGVVDPLPEKGGRKTNGYCETEPIEIIYNGPRRFIALCKTTVADSATGTNLVALYFTFIFNKVEKNVIILKDVKRLYTKQPMNIQFGNRGEWDLGIEGDTDSYTHWYTDEPVQYWDMDGDTNINATEVATSFEFFKEYMTTYKHPKKWWDDPPAYERPDTVYNEFSEVSGGAFPATWLETQPTCYGREWHMDDTIKEHSYAVAQVISKAGDYVGALAVWPHPEFWSAANTFFPPARTVAPAGNNPSSIPLMLAPISRMLEWNKWTVAEDPNQGDVGDLADRDDIWVKADDIRNPDGSTIEPIIPFIIYEHDFKLSSSLKEYRVVSVYMLTDYHDADDADADDTGNEESWSNGLNVIDREIQYQLDEIFDPWDIYDAMHKNYKRWVQFFDHDYGDHAWDGENYYCVQLDSYREVESGDLIPSLPVIRDGDWDAYCAFSERVMVDTGSGFQLIYPYIYNWYDPIPNYYSAYYTIDLDTGIICFWEYESGTGYVHWTLPVGSVVKVLWSSEHHATTAEQWDEDDLLYPIDGENFIFPLHHDVTEAYKPYTEVFLIEESPTRIYNFTETGGVDPYYNFTAGITAYSAVLNVTCGSVIHNGTEIDVKYWNETTGWHEEKFCWQNYTLYDYGLGHPNTTTIYNYASYNLTYPASYVEKVWYHSEKALTGGDYVFNNATKTLYMQDPVAAGQWLLVNYTVSGEAYANWFEGDGETTEFTLQGYPDVGSLVVNNTEILQQIVNETDTVTPIAGIIGGYRVPNIDCYWRASDGGTFENETWLVLNGLEEREWINCTDTKVQGNWIIHESPTGDYFSTCDELVLDQAALNLTQVETGWPGQELKIVFKVPSGRWEWGIVGETAASVDSLGNTMVVAAFKNKLIEFGIGGLDIQASDYGLRIPWMRSYADADNRNHLFDDWCSYYETVPDDTWPISSSNIITVGGTAVNEVTEYFNDFAQALVGTTIGNGFYAVTCWDDAVTDYKFYEGGLVTDRYGYAVISTYKDKNGTIGFMVHGWTGQDTYYAAKWFDEHKFELQHINLHVTDLILKITYKSAGGTPYCPPYVSIVEKLGTISEKPQHDC